MEKEIDQFELQEDFEMELQRLIDKYAIIGLEDELIEQSLEYLK